MSNICWEFLHSIEWEYILNLWEYIMCMNLRFEKEKRTEGRSTVWLILGAWYLEAPNLQIFAFGNLKVETPWKIPLSLKLSGISEGSRFYLLMHNANLVHESELNW